MARHKRKDKIRASDLRGFRYFRMLGPILERLHGDGAARDRAGNRRLFYDGYVSLLLLYYFTPILTSLRGLQQASTLEKVHDRLGVGRTSLGALSEAPGVYTPELLQGVVVELSTQAGRSLPPLEADALADLTAVDGSLLRALPRMAWALWQDSTHRAAKAHVAFEVRRGFPVNATVTTGKGSERAEWRRLVRPGGFYVVDRGYVDYSLMLELDALPCRFLIRIQENAVFEPLEERALSPEARAAGVVRDVLVRRLGTDKHNPLLERPMRVVVTEKPPRRPGGPVQTWVLATNDRELDADLVALGYHCRWQVELFFRWLKCIMGCRHLLSESQAGVTIQVYTALIASLLVSLRTSCRPTKRTWEMIQLYFAGWADIDELDAHIRSRLPKEVPEAPQ